MAGQLETKQQRQELHGGVIPFAVMAYSLSDAICMVGIPSLEIGLSAAHAGLVKMTDGEGTPHFEWSKEALDKRGVVFLEQLLIRLRQASGAMQ